MKNIYLCGPIKDVSTAEANAWREKAKDDFGHTYEYIGTGEDRRPCSIEKCYDFNCLDPMRRQFNDNDMLGVNEIVLMDLKDIEDADIILVNYNVAQGGTTLCGTSMEIFHASYNLDKFVVAFSDLPPEKWSPWMTKFCTRILPSLDDAIEYIKKHFGD